MNSCAAQFVPVFTSSSGRSLTSENWQALGIQLLSFDLSSLLMKPGFDFLMNLPSLANYVGWPGRLVLNASSLSLTVQGEYRVRSTYDGSYQSYTPDEIIALVVQLKPHCVILPRGLYRDNPNGWLVLPETTRVFFQAGDQPLNGQTSLYGIYHHYDKASSSPSLLEQKLAQFPDQLSYVAGALSPSLLKTLAASGVNYWETDTPAEDACQGQLYSNSETFSIQSDTEAMLFEVIDKQCACPTCQQLFTRAYLHHLFEHTPLLCQRYLIQHNVQHVLDIINT